MKKYSILFVDDDTRLLSALRRLMMTRAVEWSCQYSASPEEALALVTTQHFDVVVSDMQMPGMDGAALLQEVRIISPDSIRIVLSGYSRTETIARVAGPAHQYLAKPCPSDTLFDVIQRSLMLREFFNNPVLRRMAGALTALPSPSGKYASLLALLDSPVSNATDIAQAMTGDVAMVAEILKLTNSQYFSLATKVTSVDQAVRILGVEIIRLLVLNVGIFSMFKATGPAARVMNMVEARGLLLANAAAERASVIGGTQRDIQFARIAGMLSEIGMLILLDRDPDHYTLALSKAVASGQTVAETEQRLLQVTHGDLGAYLLGTWGFNDDVVWAVAAISPSAPTEARNSVVARALLSARTLHPLEQALKAVFSEPTAAHA